MIKGSQLIGRAVIDVEAAARLGKIKEIIVQRDGERVAGFIVVHGETIVGTGGTLRTIPASALYSIGPDAVTVHGSALNETSFPGFGDLPRMSDVIGRKMLTRSGRLLGSINDVLINNADGTIIGFAIGERVRNALENFLNPQGSRIHGYVRADADLQVGKDLIVVPDDALIEGEPDAKESDHDPPTPKTDEAQSQRWGERGSTETSRSSIWKRYTDSGPRAESYKPPPTPFPSETARPVQESRVITPAEEMSEPSPPASGSESAKTVPQDQSQT